MEDITPSAAAREVTKLGDLLLPKACENCKTRKIRCDKTSPCSSCQSAKLSCRFASKQATSKNSEFRARAAPAATYHEKHFSLIHESLREIKDKLGRLEVTQESSSSGIDPDTGFTETQSPFVPETAFQSETSFDSHTVQASTTAEISACGVIHDDLDQEIHASLTALKSLLKRNDRASSANHLSFPRANGSFPSPKIDLPPMSAVLAILKKTADKIPLVILHMGLREQSSLEDLCKKIYFPTQPISKGETTLLNGLLFYVFAEHCQEEDALINNYPAHMQLCEKNFVAGLQDYECLVTPTLENIQALLLGALKAQEDSRPALCSTLVSVGARLCQTLGYHREDVVARDPPKLGEAKRHVFWMFHMIDKTLSLNLGHTSNFPSHDIDVKMYSPSGDPRVRPWDWVMIAFHEFSKLQGQVYDDLYSVRARRASAEARSNMIEELSSKFYTWHASFKKIDTRGAQCKSDLDMMIGSTDFIFYSVLTVLYGAKTVPVPGRTNSQRYEVARLSLQCHVQNWSRLTPNDISKSGIYSDWLIDYVSFAPFLVVFTHAISAYDNDDVALLSQVLSSLESMRSRSEAHTTLCQKSRVFLRFARAFVQTKRPVSSGLQDSRLGSFTYSEGDLNHYSGGSMDEISATYELGSANGDLENMSVFLGTYFGEGSNMEGLWNSDFAGSTM